jgi:hypothetical protein
MAVRPFISREKRDVVVFIALYTVNIIYALKIHYNISSIMRKVTNK